MEECLTPEFGFEAAPASALLLVRLSGRFVAEVQTDRIVDVVGYVMCATLGASLHAVLRTVYLLQVLRCLAVAYIPLPSSLGFRFMCSQPDG